MATYQDIQEILDDIVIDRTFGAHGAFWRSLTRDQFVEHYVFGYKLILIGNPSESNLIKALRGLSPFNGVPFRRMPAGMSPASESQIFSIEEWIENGCPDTHEETFTKSIDYSDDNHNSYWREFDNWAMFQSTTETGKHIDKVMSDLAGFWIRYINSLNESTFKDWVNNINTPSAIEAIKYLSNKQRETVQKYYNDSDLPELIESYEKFGSGTLPQDSLRPQDPEHKMNGANMWAFWLCFVDATIRTKADNINFWIKMAKIVLIGMTNDGLNRQRFPVLNYTSQTIDDAKNHILNISDQDILNEIVRFVNSTGLFRIAA